ncbi:MAG: hypothetical protein R6X20_05455 [Phycisphaerae bacterium]
MVRLTSPFKHSPGARLTLDGWPSEIEAEEFLEEFIAATGLFEVYRQHNGRPVVQRHFQYPKAVRADLLLVPTSRLIHTGWSGGAIVIEVKRSGVKTGPGYSQLLDYLNSVWPVEGGIGVMPTFGFQFPVENQGGPIASIMAQQHIGTAYIDFQGRLLLQCGESRVLTLCQSGDFRIGTTNIGRRLGAR